MREGQGRISRLRRSLRDLRTLALRCDIEMDACTYGWLEPRTRSASPARTRYVGRVGSERAHRRPGSVFLCGKEVPKRTENACALVRVPGTSGQAIRAFDWSVPVTSHFNPTETHRFARSHSPATRATRSLGAPLQVPSNPPRTGRLLFPPPQNPSRLTLSYPFLSLLPSHHTALLFLLRTLVRLSFSSLLPSLRASSWSSLSLEAIESVFFRNRPFSKKKKQVGKPIRIRIHLFPKLKFALHNKPPRPSKQPHRIKLGVRRRSEIIFRPGRTRQNTPSV